MPASSFDGVVDLLFGSFPGLNVFADSREALKASARLLPPVFRGGLEFGLHEHSSAIDLHQVLNRATGDSSRLSRFLRENASSHPAWASLRRFSDGWEQPGRLPVEALFLEVDTCGPGGTPAPCLFFFLDKGDQSNPDARFEVFEYALNRVEAPYRQTPLRSLFDACRESPAYVIHVGAMLSRNAGIFRVNVSGLNNAEAAHAYLRRIGWNGDFERLKSIAAWLAPYVDELVYCLDVGDRVYPHLGLECFLEYGDAAAGKWTRLLDALQARGLCDPSRRDLLLGFDRRILPAAKSSAWPDPLIAASIFDNEQRMSTLLCKPHHVKLTLADGPLGAKGYMGFEHQWWKPELPVLPFGNEDIRAAAPGSGARHRQRVGAYYDWSTPDYITDLGPTFQAGLLHVDGEERGEASNRWLARRAGITGGMRVLDAGCGVGQPAIDIARLFSGVEVDGVTISEVQVRIARERVAQQGLSDRIRIHHHDYHTLPFEDGTFDRAVFFESMGYSDDPLQAIREVLRVLRPGGVLYVKDFFRPEGRLNALQQRDLDAFDRIYLYRTRGMKQISDLMIRVGFKDVIANDLSASVGFKNAFLSLKGRLGEGNHYPYRNLPVFIGELIATRPG